MNSEYVSAATTSVLHYAVGSIAGEMINEMMPRYKEKDLTANAVEAVAHVAVLGVSYVFLQRMLSDDSDPTGGLFLVTGLLDNQNKLEPKVKELLQPVKEQFKGLM